MTRDTRRLLDWIIEAARPILEAELEMKGRGGTESLLDLGRRDFDGLTSWGSAFLETPPVTVSGLEGKRDITLAGFANLLPTVVVCVVISKGSDVACAEGSRCLPPNQARRKTFELALQELEQKFAIRLLWGSEDEVSAIIMGCFTQRNFEVLSWQKASHVTSV